MKVEIQGENNIVFRDICEGTCFEIHGTCYMKILDEYSSRNAVNLSDGTTMFISDKTEVRVLSNAKVVLEEWKR